jgi:RNA polymerase sigma factor (sigma-70 family)
MPDKKEFIEIIKANEGLIYKVTKVYAYNKEDGQDLYQEIVYQLWRSFPSFRNDSKISTWMYRIALNTSITYFQKEKKKRNQVPIDEILITRADTNDEVRNQRIETLYANIRMLNTIEKGIILLYLEGKSYEEIAAITGFTVTNIGTRLGRIKQKLIAKIKNE